MKVFLSSYVWNLVAKEHFHMWCVEPFWDISCLVLDEYIKISLAYFISATFVFRSEEYKGCQTTRYQPIVAEVQHSAENYNCPAYVVFICHHLDRSPTVGEVGISRKRGTPENPDPFSPYPARSRDFRSSFNS